MFGWFKKHPNGFLPPTREAPPMPACKPFNPVPMPEPARLGGSSGVPKQETVQPNISEPVVTLLRMLEQDEWEVDFEHPYGRLINVYNEFVILTPQYYSAEVLVIRELMWTTKSESKALYDSCKKVVNKVSRLNKEVARERYAKLINVEV